MPHIKCCLRVSLGIFQVPEPIQGGSPGFFPVPEAIQGNSYIQQPAPHFALFFSMDSFVQFAVYNEGN